MQLPESRVGLVGCACWDSHSTLRLKKCGIILVVMATLLLSGLVFPYITSVIRHLWPPFLPFVSEAGGVPPSSGVFAVFMIPGAFVAGIGWILLFVTINQRNTNDAKSIRILNKIALCFAIISFLGLVITACNPVGYTDLPNMYEWLLSVLIDHSIGANLILSGGAIVQFFIAAIWWYLPDTTKTEKYVLLGFVGIYVIGFFVILYPLYAFMSETLNSKDIANLKTTAFDLPRVYTVNHVICSVCEYLLCVLICVNFLIRYKDLQRVSLQLVIRHKLCMAETLEPAPGLELKIIS